MPQTSLSLKSVKATGDQVEMVWGDGHVGSYRGRELRLACRCAACVDEWTHQNLIDPARIPGEVKPKKIEVVGKYALQFSWSDGHSTGIFTYDYLRSLCGCVACRSQREFSV